MGVRSTNVGCVVLRVVVEVRLPHEAVMSQSVRGRSRMPRKYQAVVQYTPSKRYLFRTAVSKRRKLAAIARAAPRFWPRDGL